MKQLVTLTVALAATALLAAGCGTTESDDGPEGELGVTVAALTEGDIGDACWTLSATNEAGVLQWSTSLCGGDFGTGASGFSYVGVCDAANPAHTISLVLDELRDASGAVIPASEYANPCASAGACVKTAGCAENADVLVGFDVVLLLDAEAGFVDVAVDLDAFPCSAKLDCLDALLLDPTLPNDPPGSARSTTAVVAVTCDTADCASLYFDDLVVDCGLAGVAVIDASGVGPAGGVLTPADPDGLLFAAVAYRQQGAETGNYLGLALGLTGAPDCNLSFALTSNGDAAPFENLTTPAGKMWPVIEFNVDLTDELGELACGENPLGAGTGVDPVFVGPDAPYTFAHELASSLPGCTVVDLCDGVVCPDDGDPCSVEACNPDTGLCVTTPAADLAPCDLPGDLCTEAVCLQGSCEPFAPVACPDDGNTCTVEVCDPDVGCVPLPIDCNDGKDCTEDSCDPVEGCMSDPVPLDGATCDVDGAPGTCDAGICVGAPVDLCAGVDCNDFNECTEDLCDPGDGTCSNDAVPNGTPCDDLDINTVDDQCINGICLGVQ